MTELQCHKCGKSFQIQNKEYNRHLRKGRQHFFCSLSCSQSYNKKTTTNIIVSCLWCNKKFKTTTCKHARKCCCNDCARKYAQSKVDKNIHKQSAQRPSTFPKEKKFRCVMCGKEFSRMMMNSVESRKTCSKICFGKFSSQWTRENPNCGGKLGYRRFPYKGYKMDSRWEVDIAKWMDDKNIKWDRSRKKYMFRWKDSSGNERKYFPDFYLPDYNIYLDPKNAYYLERDLPKLKYVIDSYRITLYYGSVEDIKKSISNVVSQRQFS